MVKKLAGILGVIFVIYGFWSFHSSSTHALPFLGVPGVVLLGAAFSKNERATLLIEAIGLFMLALSVINYFAAIAGFTLDYPPVVFSFFGWFNLVVGVGLFTAGKYLAMTNKGKEISPVQPQSPGSASVWSENQL